MTEQWRPVPGLPGYEASPAGEVRSVRRREPRILVATVGPCGFRTVNPTVDRRRTCRRVGTLVARAWLGPMPSGASEVRRLNAHTTDDRLENLVYGTTEDVHADHAARARREEAAGAPTHCPCGCRYADSWLGAWGDRLCPSCLRSALANNRAGPRTSGHRSLAGSSVTPAGSDLTLRYGAWKPSALRHARTATSNW